MAVSLALSYMNIYWKNPELFHRPSKNCILIIFLTKIIYLLFKSGEQNFHIFYYMYEGLTSQTQKAKYHLFHETDYNYLNLFDKTMSDMNRFKFETINNCFEIIGFKSQEVNSIHTLLAGLLHLGNLTFLQDEGVHNDGKCRVSNKNSLIIISQLLGVDEKGFLNSIVVFLLIIKFYYALFRVA